MVSVLTPALFFVSGLLALLACFFCVEILGAIAEPRNTIRPQGGPRRPLAVLVPAHNESNALLATIRDVKAQMRIGDRVIVIADNCTDDTAAVARSAGAETIERWDPTHIGKGFALAHGLRHIALCPPTTVVVIDADCRLGEDTLDGIARTCEETNRPAQALNLMTAPENSSIDHRVAVFAFRVRNLVRPLGLRFFGLPCQLMGTGMAFPWALLTSIELATSSSVEDLKFGLDFARMGHPPIFCPRFSVTSEFPTSSKGVESQRTRWERGHIQMIMGTVPRTLTDGLKEGNLALLTLAVDMAIPPLTLLGVLLFLIVLLSAVTCFMGASSIPLIVSLASFGAYFAAILVAWVKFGRDVLPPTSIFPTFRYALNKVIFYRKILSRRGGNPWVRTDRGRGE